MNWTIGLALLAALATGACKSDRPSRDTPGAAEGMPAPSASAVTIANTMGSCDDVAACARDCAGGSGDACRRLAVTYEFGKSDAGHDETLGTTYFDRACALGDAPGCVSSGQMHEYAHGVPKDVAAAAAAYSKACTIGSQVGCANFAIMLENGRGVRKDLERARTLYDGACKAGAGLACDRLRFLTGDAAL
jgi:TPR repeat protein